MVLEEQIKAIADAGVTVIVAGGKFGDMALHYLNKYKIMGVRLMSKFDLRRLCKSISATALPRLVSIYVEILIKHYFIFSRGMILNKKIRIENNYLGNYFKLLFNEK